MANSWMADRNPGLRQYGGAFIIPGMGDVWASFSGWDEHGDTAWLAFCLEYIELLQTRDVMRVFAHHEAAEPSLFNRYEVIKQAVQTFNMPS
jgi:hypothetical protein